MKIKICDTNALSDEKYNNMKEIVSPATLARTEKMRFDSDKKSKIAGEAAARILLSEELSISPAEINFKYTSLGKPYIDENIYFNITHSAGVAAAAVNNTEIGIDIEKTRDFDERILERVCTEKEKEYILSEKNDAEKNKKFFQIWTLKEAYLKCIGTGITVDMKSIEFTIKNGEAFPNRENFTAVLTEYNDFILSVVYLTSE